MEDGRQKVSGRPAGSSLRDLERRLEASFDALADDLSVGRRFTDPEMMDRPKRESGRKGDREPR